MEKMTINFNMFRDFILINVDGILVIYSGEGLVKVNSQIKSQPVKPQVSDCVTQQKTMLQAVVPFAGNKG